VTRRVRFRSKPVVALSIVLVLAGALGGWHTPDDVSDEYGALTTHLRTGHDAHLTTLAHRAAPEHCGLCHWLQAFGKAAPPAAQAIATESSQVIRAGALRNHIRSADRLVVSSRAPPLA
jgi:hypothetical protein